MTPLKDGNRDKKTKPKLGWLYCPMCDHAKLGDGGKCPECKHKDCRKKRKRK